ncbi:MAG: M28 family peptidase [Phycisphaeraceae bacterium]|nr:MAG: M28 family peptidase [Phycisphaeraceae bacterium]
MRLTPRLRLFHLSALTGCAATALVFAGCATDAPMGAATELRTSERSGSRSAPAGGARPMRAKATESRIAAYLEEQGPQVRAYHAHVTTLSNPFFEGRAPGTRGIELAAEYIEHYFGIFGLEPAFDELVMTPGGAEEIREGATFRQTFTVPGETIVEREEAAYRIEQDGVHIELSPEADFNPLGFGASEEISGPVVFIGYGVESGPEGYSSFLEGDNLDGAIAMLLRFEPMDEDGRSRWSDDGWSSRASLLPKARAAVNRGAAGVILVNPPGADDDRADRLMNIDTSRIGGSIDTPVIMMSTEAADDMVRASMGKGWGLMDLRRMADEGSTGAMELPELVFDMAVEAEREQIATSNVGAVLSGRGALADEYVVIGAHYDHIGYGYFGSRTPQYAGEVHAGADDNASGTSGVLLLADRLSAEYAELPEDADARSILFLAFSAEEMGLLGARHFVANPTMSLSQITLMMNMDMIGRLRENGLELNGVGTATGLRDIVQPRVDASGLNVNMRDSGQMPSDQAVFVQENIPVLGFFTGIHPEYHSVFDVASTINHVGAVAIANLVGDIATDIAMRPEGLEYVQVGGQRGRGAGPVTRARVQLGIAPGDYSDDTPGLLVGGVTEGTTAANAGVLAGDRIIRWGGEEMAGVAGLMERLAAHEPGDRVVIVVERDGEEIELTLELQGRTGPR